MVLVLLASSPIRHAFYESFLHLHILLAVMAFVPLWYHLQHLPQRHILFTTAMLWCFDVRPSPFISDTTNDNRELGELPVLFGATAADDVQLLLWRSFLGQLPALTSLLLDPGSSSQTNSCTCTFRRWGCGPRTRSRWRGRRRTAQIPTKSAAYMILSTFRLANRNIRRCRS